MRKKISNLLMVALVGSCSGGAYCVSQPESNPEEKLLTISLIDYLALTGKEGKDFTAIGVEHCGYHSVRSGSTQLSDGERLPPIENLEKQVRGEFLAKLPPNTVVVVSVQKIVEETPTGFFSEGRQSICYQGTALVAKAKVKTK